MMLKSFFYFVLLCSLAGLNFRAAAQSLDKQHFNHNEWTKGRFSEVVTVSGPGKWVFLAGVGAEAEKDGSILHVGDFAAQCNRDNIIANAKGSICVPGRGAVCKCESGGL